MYLQADKCTVCISMCIYNHVNCCTFVYMHDIILIVFEVCLFAYHMV